MKNRLLLASCLTLAMVFLESACAQKAPDKPPVFRSGEYAPFSFPALKAHEHLSYQFVRGNDVTLKLFEVRAQSERRLIGTWDNFPGWGELVFTRDHRSCFFRGNDNADSGVMPVWFLNGNNGTMTVSPNIGGSYSPTGDGRFIVYSITKDPSTYRTIYLYDVKKGKVVKTFSWPTKTSPETPLTFYREQASNEIIVAMFGESRELAQGVISPDKQTLTMQWDKSNSGGIHMDATIAKKFDDKDIISP